MHISTESALTRLLSEKKEFINLFSHGTLSLEVYKPNKIDKQKPHDRDEVYIIISGKGEFFNDGERVNFQPGDFLFVKAGKEHRFENFSEDFSTWVIFYGPIGRERE